MDQLQQFKNQLIIVLKMTLLALLFAIPVKTLANPGKAYLFAYTKNENRSRNGLHFAWSTDKVNWHKIGPEHGFLFSDYGRWGSQKRLVQPFLFQDTNGLWHAIWSVNESDTAFAHAASEDLVHWKRQSYPMPSNGSNVLEPVVFMKDDQYVIQYKSDNNGSTEYFQITTSDFKSYSKPQKIDKIQTLKTEVVIGNETLTGTLHQVDWKVIQGLIDAKDLSKYKQSLHAETTAEDATRFDGLESVSVAVKVQPEQKKQISDKLMGIFFEDINYAADGGLYAELIQNRDFEYHPSDKQYRDKNWNHFFAWTSKNIESKLDSVNPIHENNKYYLILNNGESLTNEGFDAIPLKADEKYNFSISAKTYGNSNKLLVQLVDDAGKVYDEVNIKVNASSWKKYQKSFKIKETVADAKLVITPQNSSKVAVDMVSLFPENTFHNHKNGLRKDLAQVIADLHPQFVRFPGGCVAHGDGVDNIYDWKSTIGPLETRKPNRNLWNYHQTVGLGYYEYFQFCEDINAAPVPVIAAGVPCQNSGTGGAGQQCGIPMEEMDAYIQDILDLIEWANGDAATEWGKKRAAAGHPKPFNLKYIGIGNEDLITDVFEERFTMIFNAIQEKHPEITVIGTVGPFYEGTDYDEGWEIANRLAVPMVDEHYYVPPGWFIYNQDYYDAYDRNNAKVYLGEYASHLPGRPSNIETALSEALYLAAVERNGDIVEMTSYAPLLAKEHHTQWTPDLIYFNNTEVKPTTDYYVQQLYGQNAGTIYYNSKVLVDTDDDKVQKRIGVSVVEDEKDDAIIVKYINMLPVSVNVTTNLGTLITSETTAEKTVFSGKPDAKEASLQTEKIKTTANQNMELAPYSFTVIRINKTNK
ncbi:Carbohydrate binding domain-containing protein [Pustulibacterium marinum]|uniref:non-reducing end alpha-L-arabinofuranosidase n=1 Tax=Pustulibacterium marinum TaxID=1224947 RepID=A0A1I7H658_9FLAO|nr:alpha-L-arabinofuranosidase C-terminal domain-containing protein [Pustulibacterium marinum]SFU56168.1 Carbohydrate binding domain-containing protein [Pustulibacterium marinum]